MPRSHSHGTTTDRAPASYGAAGAGSRRPRAIATRRSGTAVRRVRPCCSVAAAEQAQHEQEDVEDVEEDPRRDRHRTRHVRAAQAVEVEDREAAEDHQPGDRVDQVRVRDRDEDPDQTEHDQREQRPEQRSRPRGEIAPGRVAVRAEPRDERRGRACGLPQRRRGRSSRTRSGPDRTASPSKQPEPEQQADRELLVTSRDAMFSPKMQANAPMNISDAGAAAEIAPDIGAERRAADRQGDQAHDLAEHLVRAIARDRRAAPRPATWSYVGICSCSFT